MIKKVKKILFIVIILSPVFVYARDYENVIAGLDKEIIRYSNFDIAYLYLLIAFLMAVFAFGFFISKLSKR